MWNSALRETFKFIFKEPFSSIDKALFFGGGGEGGGVGGGWDWVLGYNSMKFWYYSELS